MFFLFLILEVKFNYRWNGDGEPAEFKIVVMDKFKDAMSRQLSEALNIKNQVGKSEILNSKSEYHQPQIVRLRKSVQVGL